VRLDPAGRVAAVRVSLGAVGPIPVRAHAVEQALLGEVPTAARLRDAAEAVRSEIDPLDDARGSAGYKRDMAVVCTRRALADVAA
jgi:CO/xanthine dehydrogenase FAD-binding subunit